MKNINVKEFKKFVFVEDADIIIISEFNEEGCNFLDELEIKLKTIEKDELQSIVNDTISILGINPKRVLCYGKVEEKPPPIFKKLCPNRKIRRGAMSLKEKSNIMPITSYKCFVGFDNSDERFNFVMHEAIENSWNCAITKLNNPTHAIIYIE